MQRGTKPAMVISGTPPSFPQQPQLIKHFALFVAFKAAAHDLVFATLESTFKTKASFC
jgi:hypothetical protein